MTDFKAKMHQNSISAGALPQTPLRELTALPRPPCWIWGTALRQRERLGWGRGGKGEGKGSEGKGRGGKGRDPKLLLNHGPSSLSVERDDVEQIT